MNWKIGDRGSMSGKPGVVVEIIFSKRGRKLLEVKFDDGTACRTDARFFAGGIDFGYNPGWSKHG